MSYAVTKIKGSVSEGIFVFSGTISLYQALDPQFISAMDRMLMGQLKKIKAVTKLRYKGFEIATFNSCLKILKIKLMIRYSV